MSVALPVLTALAAVAALLGVMALVRRTAVRRGWAPEVQRKSVHVATGLFAISLPWLFAEAWPVWFLLALTLGVMGALRLPALRTRLGAALHSVERRSWGDFMLAAAVGLLFLFSDGSAILYVLPLAIVTLADAAAALAGSLYGRRFFVVEDGQKSLEGSAVFFLVAMLVVMVCLLLLTEVGRGNVVLLGLMIAAFATLVEADSWRGFDNLFLPLGIFLFLDVHLDAGALELVAQAGLFIVALVAFRVVAPSLGLSPHAARVYVIAAFLLLSATAVQNAVLPLLVLAAHLWARIANPTGERFPDLDIVAALAVLGFGALALGEAVGANALSFYTLAAAAIAAGLTSVAAATSGRVTGAALRVAAPAALLGLWGLLGSLNPAAVQWHGSIWPAAVAIVAAATLAPAARPPAFAGERALKLAVLGIVPSFGLYLLLAMPWPPG